jgi:pimeloyl-ACP methyl ester carboxylesterase
VGDGVGRLGDGEGDGLGVATYHTLELFRFAGTSTDRAGGVVSTVSFWAPVERNGRSGGLAFHRRGDGPPVVLVHGVGLRLESWLGQIDELAQRASVVAVDLPGHGESERLDEPVPELSDLSDAIVNLIKAEIGEPCVVMGHSLGALVAMDIATRSPTLVRGLVALTPIFQRSESALNVVGERVEWLASATDAEVAEMPMPRWFGESPDDRLRVLADVCRGWLREGDREGYRAAYRVFASEAGPLESAIGVIACPALFFTAEFDPNSTPAMSEALAAIAPKGRAYVLQRARHMMQMTHIEAVNSVLDGFLNDLERGAG